MASSSSSTYDVFLSFRGPDTRKTFTGHLHTALIQAGIRTFLDDKELETGKRISADLPTAIEQSKISIVVLSKTYARSRWCLDELLKIIECMDTSEHLVFPIYYDVKPLDVRYQIGSFAEAFTYQASREDTHKLETWKSALTRIADLKGWDVAKVNNGCEATVISQVLEKVHLVLINKTLLTAHIYPGLVGMHSRIATMKSRWEDRSTNCAYFIVLYGMGGVGKTTTALAFYDSIVNDSFKCQYVLENIGERSRKGLGSLLQLQERLLSSILYEDLRLDSLSKGAALMSQKLSSLKVLIIFDDIDKPDQVNALIGDRSWFGPGSTIIITTRDKSLLEKIPADEEYLIEVLEVSQSKELFSRHAFKGSPVPEPHKQLLKDIVHYCGGLPLALQVLGSHLFNKSLKEWKHALNKVRAIPMSEIQEKLRISYDGLDVDEKTIFLDIACLFIGNMQDDLITLLKACNLHAATGISRLKQKCLLTVKGNTLEMHDLLRDMGRHIVREESQRIGERSRLWVEEEIMDVLKNNKGTERIQCIYHVNSSKEITFTTEVFENMRYLRLLRLENVCLTGSFHHIFVELKSLCWQKCPLKCLPSSFEPEHLVVLDLRHSKNLITVWEDTLNLPRLKKLDLRWCTELRRTPNFKGVKNLKILLLQGCDSLEEIHHSIGHLSRLVKLHIENCKRLKSLPSSISNLSSLRHLNLNPSLSGLRSLEYLGISGWEPRDIPDDICTLSSRTLPGSLSQLSGIASLYLGEYTNLESLPGLPPNLISLYLYGCKSLESLPEVLPPNLEYINAWGCKLLKKLPNLSHLQRLTTLILGQCRRLNGVWGLGNLLGITMLYLSGCTNLESLPSLPPNLISLNLCGCTGLESLPELLPPSLVYINATNCISLEKLSNLGHLQSLTQLILTNCSRLCDIQGLGNLIDIKKLNFSGCMGLESLAVLPPNLKRLDVSGCTSLGSLSERLPPNLEYVNAMDCISLEKLANLGHLQSLTQLILTNCCRLNDIQGLGNLLNIEELHFIDCMSLESLTVLPPNLKRLYVNGCKRLQALPEIIPTNLEHIHASGCPSLEKMQNLKYLHGSIELILRNCSRLDDILGLDNLIALSFVNLRGCINLARADHALQSLITPPFSEFRPEITLVMPKIEIPDWFVFGNNDDTIYINMPHTNIQRFIGFAICFICTTEYPIYEIVIDNETSHSVYIHTFNNKNHSIYDEFISVVIQVQHQIPIQGGDNIKIYAGSTSPITNIGVCSLYKSSEETKDADDDGRHNYNNESQIVCDPIVIELTQTKV